MPTVRQLIDGGVTIGTEVLKIGGFVTAASGVLWVVFGDEVDAYVDSRTKPYLFDKDDKAIYLRIDEADRRMAQVNETLTSIKTEQSEQGRVQNQLQLDAATTKGTVQHLDTQLNNVERKIDANRAELQKSFDELKNILIQMR